MIRVNGISKKFWSNGQEIAAVADASIDVGDDEILVLLGSSGSGKTTLLRCIAGLETADQGEIQIGSDVVFSRYQHKNVPAEMRGLGMVFQSYAIWPHLTVAENVALPLTHGRKKISKSEVKARVLRALSAVHLAGLEDRPAPYLSGGQQQRVALARALAVEPSALLMDEPLCNLDARLREEVRFEIQDIAKKAGVPVLYVTHDQIEAMELGDRVAIMENGRILQVDTPDAVYNRPKSVAVAKFLGSMNWLQGQCFGKDKINTVLGDLIVPGATKGTNINLGIRPERIGLSLSQIDDLNTFRGRCVGVSFLGDHKLYQVQLGETTIVAKQLHNFAQDFVGKDIYVTLPGESIHIFSNNELLPDNRTVMQATF